MGERDQNRSAVDRVTKRLVEHAARQGKPITDGEARKQAAQAGREGDRNRDEARRKGKIR